MKVTAIRNQNRNIQKKLFIKSAGLVSLVAPLSASKKQNTTNPIAQTYNFETNNNISVNSPSKGIFAFKETNDSYVKEKIMKVASNTAKTPNTQQTSDLRVFHHHIYEYKKGLRNLVLTTEKAQYQDYIEKRLNNEKINYVIQKVNEKSINVFFGAKNCIDVVKTFVSKKLNELTPEQDFILGIMLGYDRNKQCDRYLKFKEKEAEKQNN